MISGERSSEKHLWYPYLQDSSGYVGSYTGHVWNLVGALCVGDSIKFAILLGESFVRTWTVSNAFYYVFEII